MWFNRRQIRFSKLRLGTRCEGAYRNILPHLKDSRYFNYKFPPEGTVLPKDEHKNRWRSWHEQLWHAHPIQTWQILPSQYSISNVSLCLQQRVPSLQLKRFVVPHSILGESEELADTLFASVSRTGLQGTETVAIVFLDSYPTHKRLQEADSNFVDPARDGLG